MRIQLSEHFTYKKLIRFVLPSIIMMIFTSIYGVIDGLFVSNFVGKTAFASINLIMPLLMGLSALGFMIGTGGSAIVSKALEKANASWQTSIFPCWSTSQSSAELYWLSPECSCFGPSQSCLAQQGKWSGSACCTGGFCFSL